MDGYQFKECNLHSDNCSIELILSKIDSLEKVDVDQRFRNIESHLKHFIMICSGIDRAFKNGINFNIENATQNVLGPLNEALKIIRNESNSLQQLRREFQDDTVLGTLKFMAKELHELSKEVRSIKENGVKKAIHLDLTMDGYEMVRKKQKAGLPEEKLPSECPIRLLLETLGARESNVLIHKYGLFGEKQKTFTQMEKIFGIGRERISQIHRKTLIKCVHPSRKKLVENITHFKLKKGIRGK